ncbi:MAG: multicopper oxidase domain-containing protein [Polyangiaceae bacterium]|nr:multicopper oxidase domain-containing protein [Polyangiaceae bacterium]
MDHCRRGIVVGWGRRLAGTLVVVGAAACGGGDSGGAATPAPPGCVSLADGRCVAETFHDPATLEPDADGVYQLSLQPTEFTFEGQRHCGRGYNGVYPGPTIETAAGSGRQVRVDLRNRFTKSALRGLSETACTCTDATTGASCTGGHGHDSACKCTDATGATCHVFDFNTTNLHAHGSHVRPDYARGGGCVERDGLLCRSCDGDRSVGARACFHADDVLSRVAPGSGARHRWDIDEDGPHHEGLHWYHPHIHGSTAIQIAGGAAGAWIVRGPVDELPGVKRAKERVWLVTTPPADVAPLPEGQACDEDHLTFDDFYVLGDTSRKQTNLVNGVRRPRLVMPPGQIERWRFLHASFLDEIQLVVFKGKDSDCANLDLAAGPVPLTQIARDGITMPRPPDGVDWPFAPPYVFMAPGYRVEALLDGSKLSHGETLCVMSGRFLQEDTTGATGGLISRTTAPTPDDILKTASNGDLLAIVNVTTAAGAPSETQMPDLEAIAALAPGLTLGDGEVDALARCKDVQGPRKPEQIDQLVAMWMLFYNTEGLDQCAFPDHNLNAKNFEHTDRDRYPYDRVLTKGAVDHWRITSGFDGHPFHIHINPFLVCPLPPAGSSDPNVKSRLFEPPFAHFRDTYLVNLDRTLDALAEYREFTGSFVFHCHKLNHEDHGMMELVRVCDPATEACDQLCGGARCDWKSCRAGDDECARALAATLCLFDPAKCPEAKVRCTPCNGEGTCPPGGTCGSTPAADGKLRCAPGCATDTDCPPTHACIGGACSPAPCAAPCPPPSTCQHGACK